MIVSELKIGYFPKMKNSEREELKTSQKAYQVLLPFYNDIVDYREFSYLICLNRGNKIIGVYKLGEGGLSGVVIDPKAVFQAALLANAHAIILSHNHPSGQLKPSDQDIALTRKIKQIGELMDLTLLDHIIITSEGYYSFGDQGLV